MDEAQIKELRHKEMLYRQMIGLYPQELKYRRRLSEILLQLGDEKGAIDELTQLERLYEKQGEKSEADSLKKLRHSISDVDDLNATLNPFLSGIQATAMNMLMRDAKRLDLKEGDMLIRQGNTDDAVYIVIEGELAVLAEFRKKQKPVLIHILKEGEIVGEMAFLNGNERTASVIANTRATVLKLSPKRVLKCMLEYPEVGIALRSESEFRNNLRAIHANALMASLTQDDKERLAMHSVIQTYAPFSVVSRSQETLEWVGIMVSGLVRMVAEDKVGNSHLLDPIKPGDLIGEMSALQDEPIIADMVAVNESSILQIPVDQFRKFMEANPIVKKRMIDNAYKRIASTMTYIQGGRT